MRAKYDLLKRYGGEGGLRQALVSGTVERAAVDAELAAIKDIHKDRCVVTAEYRDALNRVIASLE